MKNKTVDAKKHEEISIYINFAQSHQKTSELSIGTTTFQTFVINTGVLRSSMSWKSIGPALLQIIFDDAVKHS